MNKKLSTNVLVITLINLTFWYVTIKIGLFSEIEGMNEFGFSLSHTALIIVISLVLTYIYSFLYRLITKADTNRATAFYLISIFFTILFVFTNTLRP